MKCLLFIFLNYLLENIKSAKIYQCGRHRDIPNQCRNQLVDIYGKTKVYIYENAKWILIIMLFPKNMMKIIIMEFIHIIIKKYMMETLVQSILNVLHLIEKIINV